MDAGDSWWSARSLSGCIRSFSCWRSQHRFHDMGFVRKLLCLVLLLTLGVWLRWPSPGVLDGKCEARYLASSTTERFGSVECRLGVLQHHALSFTVRDCGDPHAAAIVLLHGFPDDYGTWEHQIEPLVSQARRRVLVPVLRGYEPSSQPRTMWYRPISSGLANGYHATALASDLVCLLDALQLDRADVLGHDWGAVIAHLAGGLYPERINKLVTIAVPPQFATDTAGVARVAPSQLRNSWYMLFFQLPVIPELALQYGHVLHKLLSDWSPSFSWPSHRHAHIVSLTFQLPGVVVR